MWSVCSEGNLRINWEGAPISKNATSENIDNLSPDALDAIIGDI